MCIKKLFDIYCEISRRESSRGEDLDTERLFIHPIGERIEEFYVSYLDFIGDGVVSISEDRLPAYLARGFKLVEGRNLLLHEGEVRVRRE